MAEIYARKPDGSVVAIDEADQQAAANAGYTPLAPDELRDVQRREVAAMPRDEAVRQGKLEAKPFAPGVDTESGLSQESEAFLNTVKSGLTFGQLPSLRTPEAVAAGRRFEAEHPTQAAAGAAIGGTPLLLATGTVGGAITGAAEGAGLLARAGAAVADFGINAAGAGAQIEGENARLAGRDFSYTDAALAGVAAETIGRTAGWTVSKAIGGARNLLATATQNAVKDTADRSLSRGGFVADYRVAQHAEAYHNQLAQLAADDLDTLETSFADVSRQDRKRARIMASVVDNQAVQRPINIEAADNLRQLRSALEDELGDNPTGPAKRLAKQLDDRIDALDAAPRGKQLWRLLDENRQALQEYRQDLHQAYDTNPGSAWLSRDGLAAIDAAEEHTRNALLREDAWGESAAQMQREYNTPFHEKWFPARQTVLKDLYFATGKDANGFTTYRGEPSKVLGLLKSAPEDVDKRRVRELFAQYLDGASAIAKAGERDAPAASRDTLEAVRRLRKAMANADYVTQAAASTARREAVVDVAGLAGGAIAGAATGGPALGVAMAGAGRAVRLGHWLSRAARELGLFRGVPVDFAKVLAEGALPGVEHDAGAALTDQLTRDFAEAPFPPAASVRPAAAEAGPLRGAGPRVIEGAPPPEAIPGPGPISHRVGQPVRQAGAGLEALQPARNIDVGGGAPARLPDERPTLQNIERRATDRPAGGAYQNTERPTGLDVSAPPPPAPAGGSYQPVPRRGMPSDLVNRLSEEPTHPAPYRTEGMAWYSGRMGEGAEARAAEAARLEALTSDEFAQAVEGLRTAGAKTPEGESVADVLAKAEPELRAKGLVADDARAIIDRRRREGGHVFLGARMPTPDEPIKARLDLLPARGDLEDLPAASPEALQRFSMMADRAEAGFAPEEREAVGHFVGTGYEHIKNVERGITPQPKRTRAEIEKRLAELRAGHTAGDWNTETLKEFYALSKEKDALTAHERAPHFAEALDRTTVLHPTNAGPLYRGLGDIPEEAVHELLDRGTFVTSSHTSTSFSPTVASGFAGTYNPETSVLLKFDAVDHGAIAAMGKAGAGEYEVLLPPKMRFRVVDRGRLSDGRLLVTVKQDGWATAAELHEHSALGAVNLSQNLKDLATSPLTAGAAVGAAGLGGYAEARKHPDAAATVGEYAGAGALGAAALFGSRAAILKLARTRLVADVAKRLFSATYEPAVKLASRAVVAQYSRADLAKRQQEFQSWQANPQELVDRVAEGFRETPPEHFADVSAAIYQTANFLKQRLPQSNRSSAVAVRDIPVSREALNKYARYEDAALQPRQALQTAAVSGHMSPELLETLGELYPDLLAELRVQAYQTVREDGPPPTIQGRVSYGRLFGGDGSLADPAMSLQVRDMAALAYAAAPPVKPGPASGPRVSAISQAAGLPAGVGARTR